VVGGAARAPHPPPPHHSVNTIKIGVKLALLIVILGLVYVKRDDEKVDKGLFGLVGLLTTANIFIAVLWT
jgi:hypothetical protein